MKRRFQDQRGMSLLKCFPELEQRFTFFSEMSFPLVVGGAGQSSVDRS